MAKSDTPKYNLVVLVPSRGLLITKSIDTLIKEITSCKYVRKWEIVFSYDMTVDKARQWLAEQFIEERPWADFAFWMDDDQVLTEGILTRMFEAKGDFVTCHVVNRSPKNIQPGASPTNRMKPIFWFPPDNQRKDFETGDLTFISLAVSLTSRKLFEDIPKPWFKSELDPKLPSRYWEDGYFSAHMLKHQRTKFKCVVLPEFCPHWELTDFAGTKGTRLRMHSYFHSDTQCHQFDVYDQDTLFPQEDNASMIHGCTRPDIVVAERFKK